MWIEWYDVEMHGIYTGDLRAVSAGVEVDVSDGEFITEEVAGLKIGVLGIERL